MARGRKPDYHAYYKTSTWLRLRKLHLSEHPLCAYCYKRGIYTPANTVDHIKPHKGDWQLFTDPTNFQSLCPTCHSSAKQTEEHTGYSTAIGLDGWPLSPDHPANRT